MSTLETKNQQNLQYLQYQQNQPHKIYLKIISKHNSTKIFENFKIFQKKYHNPKIFENQCPTIFGNSWSMNFSKFMVHEFFGIHGPCIFEIQCPTIFCDFGLFNSLAQAGGGGAYYMIFHYQKHTVLNYCR